MRLLMLCREPRLYSCQRLLDVAQANGHEMDILDPNRFLLRLTESSNQPQWQLYYQKNPLSEPSLLPQYDAVLPRFGPTSTKMGCAILQHLHHLKCYCLNHAQPIEIARDKWRSLQQLQAANIPIPTTSLIGKEVNVNDAVNFNRLPIILKTLSGTQGVGVMLLPHKHSTISVLETLNQANIDVISQDFITEANGKDLRCFVVGNQVIAAMERISQQNEFRANFHRGGTANTVNLTAEERRIAIQATQALNLEVAGVDIIRTTKGPLVLEVNASPGLELIEKTTGIDIALQIIAYLEKQFRQG